MALSALQIIAERRIEEAMRDGGLQIEHWRNRPLPEEDLSLVPEELRMAYRILKNAGYLPPEIELRKEISSLRELLATTSDEQARLGQLRKLEFLIMKLNQLRDRPCTIEAGSDYHRRITEKITTPQDDRSGKAASANAGQ